MTGNTLYYGDNLKVLREHVADESVDLVYLDPPFNSNADYNVLFSEKDGTRAASQIKAFGDTWHWDQSAALAYQEVVEAGGKTSQCLQAFRTFLGENDMLAYLSMMAPRLMELRRALKSTGSIYLHCDPTASHYLKLLMDAVFGPEYFRNEIIWRRADPKGHAFTRFPSTHDTLLYFAKDADPTWTPQYADYDPSYLKSHYSSIDSATGRNFTLSDCTNPNKNRPNLTYEWKGITKVWRWTRNKMEQMDREGRLVYTKSGAPRYKRFLDEMPGTPITTLWDDIPFLNSQAQERLGYPTQKPEALLERIISASCPEDGTVLDPFCGCGTAIAAAQKLDRKWIGIDITHLAITLIKHRLFTAFGQSIGKTYKVIGEPEDIQGATQLAVDDPYQFQWWALSLVHARPTEQKKGADKGIDGRLYFHDEVRRQLVEGADDGTDPKLMPIPSGKRLETKQVIFQVKAGHTSSAHVRDLRGVLDREKAQIGVLISLQESTQPMRTEAASAGFYKSHGGAQYPTIQLLTVRELLDGRGVNMPGWHQQHTFKSAPKAKGKNLSPQTKLFEPDEPEP